MKSGMWKYSEILVDWSTFEPCWGAGRRHSWNSKQAKSPPPKETWELPVRVCVSAPTVCCACKWNTFPICDPTPSESLKRDREMCVNTWLSGTLSLLPPQLYRVTAILLTAKQISNNRRQTVQTARGKELGERIYKSYITTVRWRLNYTINFYEPFKSRCYTYLAWLYSHAYKTNTITTGFQQHSIGPALPQMTSVGSGTLSWKSLLQVHNIPFRVSLRFCNSI